MQAQPHLLLCALSHVKGLHLNMAFIVRNTYTLSLLLGQRFGRLLGYTEKDIERIYPLKEKVFYSILRESGYMHIQATKPDTVGEHPGVGDFMVCKKLLTGENPCKRL